MSRSRQPSLEPARSPGQQGVPSQKQTENLHRGPLKNMVLQPLVQVLSLALGGYMGVSVCLQEFPKIAKFLLGFPFEIANVPSGKDSPIKTLQRAFLSQWNHN